MRYIRRTLLDDEVLKFLEIQTERSSDLAGSRAIQARWNSVRKMRRFGPIRSALDGMGGPRARCMYCEDSHGSDIEHFWPKTPYPHKMFNWDNLLICCTECGRLKGDLFPLGDDGQPLLINPTMEDPWCYLDYDPETGNIVARFDILNNTWSGKGCKSVEILRLDGREALANCYKRTFSRLNSHALSFLDDNSYRLVDSLFNDDDTGLLGWILIGTGQGTNPFARIREEYPLQWDECVRRYSGNIAD